MKLNLLGLRPGEKLYEEMLMKEEGMKTTPNKMIHIGKPIQLPDDFFDQLDHLYVKVHLMKIVILEKMFSIYG